LSFEIRHKGIKGMNIADPHYVFRGITYGQWAGVWTNKLFSDHPDAPYSGERSMVFLRGNIGYAYKEDPEHAVFSTLTKESAIKILPDTAVFVPIVNSMFMLDENYEGQTMNHEIPMRDTARRDTFNGGDLGVQIRQDPTNTDYPLVTNLDDFYIESPLFTLTIPENSAYRESIDEVPLEPGVYQCITAGFFVIISKWPIGTYRLSILGKGVGKYLTKSIHDIVVTGTPRLLTDISPPPAGIKRDSTIPRGKGPIDPMDFVADWNDPKAAKP
jgi:hypothetical protein